MSAATLRRFWRVAGWAVVAALLAVVLAGMTDWAVFAWLEPLSRLPAILAVAAAVAATIVRMVSRSVRRRRYQREALGRFHGGDA